MTATVAVPAAAWRNVNGAPISVEAARILSRQARCERCRGSLILDFDDDERGNGRLVCLACGHEVADVTVRQ